VRRRDEYMASHLRELDARGDVVVVMGAMHVDGVERLLTAAARFDAAPPPLRRLEEQRYRSELLSGASLPPLPPPLRGAREAGDNTLTRTVPIPCLCSRLDSSRMVGVGRLVATRSASTLIGGYLVRLSVRLLCLTVISLLAERSLQHCTSIALSARSLQVDTSRSCRRLHWRYLRLCDICRFALRTANDGARPFTRRYVREMACDLCCRQLCTPTPHFHDSFISASALTVATQRLPSRDRSPSLSLILFNPSRGACGVSSLFYRIMKRHCCRDSDSASPLSCPH